MSELALAQTQQTQGLMKPIATARDLIHYHEEMTTIIKEAFKDGKDYGLIPNTNKPTLFKPGAERICLAFGAHPEYEIVEKEIDHDRKNEYKSKYNSGTSYGLYRYVYKCRIVTQNGKVLGEGHGVCSTLESKYISRPRDSENTACKMAQKRAFVAATLHSFGLSDRFTQDVEDFQENGSPKGDSQPPKAQAAPQPVEIVFDQKDFSMLDRLEKKLIEMNIPADKHEAIAAELNGKPMTQESFDGAVFKHHVIETVFPG